MDNPVPQQDQPERFGASLWGSSIKTINVAGNTIEETLAALKEAAEKP
jgi:hypothetical protein